MIGWFHLQSDLLVSTAINQHLECFMMSTWPITQIHAMNVGSSNELMFVCVSEFSLILYIKMYSGPHALERGPIDSCVLCVSPECTCNSLLQTSSFHD